MAIKNNDGSVYKLRGPNPVMKKQEIWNNEEEFKLYNCHWEHETINDNSPKLKTLHSDFIIKEKEIKIINNQTEPEIKIIERNKPSEPPKLKVKQLHDKVIFHCLNAIQIKVEDNFYEEERPKIEYDKTFSFEAIITSQDDINMMFWTNIKIAKQSIVYPQNAEKRWWEIIEVQKRGEGYLHITVPTSINPNFEKSTTHD
jgi:hypothetical protein